MLPGMAPRQGDHSPASVAALVLGPAKDAGLAVKDYASFSRTT
jgi:hypothetical protein